MPCKKSPRVSQVLRIAALSSHRLINWSLFLRTSSKCPNSAQGANSPKSFDGIHTYIQHSVGFLSTTYRRIEICQVWNLMPRSMPAKRRYHWANRGVVIRPTRATLILIGAELDNPNQDPEESALTLRHRQRQMSAVYINLLTPGSRVLN